MGMKRWKQLAALCSMAAICLTGCGEAKVPEAIGASTVVVSEKGQITVHLVSEFDKSYYDLKELTAMAEEEVAEFHASDPKGNTDSVSVEQAELLENAKVKLTYRFDTWEDYTRFNEGQLFYGSVEEAAEKKLFSGVSLKSVKDGTVIGEEQIKQDGRRMMVITDADADIYCPGKVIYISEGAAVNEDGSVAATKAEGLVYILMK